MRQLRVSRIQRGKITSRYKKYRPAISVGLMVFSSGLAIIR